MTAQAPAAQQSVAQQLVLLIGAPHSGTQWVQLLLGQHPDIATGAATEVFSHYLQPLLAARRSAGNATGGQGLASLYRPEEYRRLVTGIAAVVLRRIGARKPRARFLLEASPEHALVWREILEFYPAARFIHVVRDPRSVVAAQCREPARSPAAADTAGIINASMAWLHEIETVRRLVEDSGRCHELRYEQLQQRPADVLRELMRWLGLDADADQCRGFVARLSQHGGKSRRPPWVQPAADEPGDDWHLHLKRRDLACVEAVNRDAMIRYDYASEAPGQRRARLRVAAYRLLQVVEDSAQSIRRRI